MAGELTPDERIAFEDEALSNPELTDRLYADVSVREALESAARARREREVTAASAQPWWRRGLVRWLAPVAVVAAVAVFMFTQQTQTPDGPPVFRGGGGDVVAVEPAGEVDQLPSHFTWTALAGATYYRFELFDAASTLVLETVTADTALIIDPATTEVPAEGYWVVTPLNDLRVRAGEATLTRYRTAE